MKYIVTAEEMREYDNNTITRIGIPAMVLMERAALAVRDVIVKDYFAGQRVLIVAGTGNNGADGLALGRLLSEEGFLVNVCIVGKPERETEQFKQQLKILEHYPIEIWDRQYALVKLKDVVKNTPYFFDIVVDSVFGVGLSREINGEFRTAIESMNVLKGLKVAVDIPSGICADTGKVLGVAFRAEKTVTFGFQKLGICFYPGADYAGQIHIADIGITKSAFFERKPEVFAYDETPAELLPKRKSYGNKGTFGKVLLIAGFEKMTGAAILCARAALELGAGMVKVICPLENREILQTAVPEVLYGTCEDLENSIKWADVVAIGPGMGKDKEAESALLYILTEAKLPLVVDADALNLISASQKLKTFLRSYSEVKILTPHVGELARLCGWEISKVKECFQEVAKNLAKEYHCIMVCKDAVTLVAGEKDMLYLNLSGNSGMATAGSGDVLTGMIAALLAQSEERRDVFKAATAGVYMHGLAGDVAAQNYTEYGVTASRIIEMIRGLLRE